MIDATNPVAFLDPNSPDAKDPSNPLAANGIKAIDLGGRHSSAVFREFVPGALVVKAFIISMRTSYRSRQYQASASCSIRAMMPAQKPKFGRLSNARAISRLTSVCWMLARR